jgi:hypothetical protein
MFDQNHIFDKYELMNLVTLKAGAKHELLFNKLAPEVGSLNI